MTDTPRRAPAASSSSRIPAGPSRVNALAVGRAFVRALATRDWDGLAACFESDARFRAVVPDPDPFRDRSGADESAALFRRWFGGTEAFELVGSRVETIADRLHMSWRAHCLEDGAWSVIEQQGYATLGATGIAYLNLVCSGFRPIDAPGA